MESILIQFSFANSDVKMYNGVIRDLESAGYGNIPERLFHVAAPNGKDWLVTDIWESFEAFNRFAEVMIPILLQNGGKRIEPLILPVYNIITPKQIPIEI